MYRTRDLKNDREDSFSTTYSRGTIVDRMILIGQPEQRRSQLLQRALHARGHAPATVIDWSALLHDPEAIAAGLNDTPERPVKLDSPGESAALHDALVRHGWHRLGESGAAPPSLAHGELSHQHMWFAGFSDVLRRLDAAATNVRWMNPPNDILRMCDKRGCQERLMSAGIDIPPLIGPIDGYAQLRDRLRIEGVDRVFIKSRYGSSAAGVIAYRLHRDGREVAYSSAEIVRDNGGVRLFNSLIPRRYIANDEIAALIDAVAVQGAYAESWIAKPRATGNARENFDVRVMSFAGAPRQRVARIASQPMTNLHLGNRRGIAEELLDPATLQRIEDCVRRAASAFPNAMSIGFDLIPGAERVRVLEANAFGDLLPELYWQGVSTYDDQAAWFAEAAHATECANSITLPNRAENAAHA
jgi:glutathione synthase/RimK-type ligase-like ATP-grasp enzyme